MDNNLDLVTSFSRGTSPRIVEICGSLISSFIEKTEKMDSCPKTEVEQILEYQRKMFAEKLKLLQRPNSMQTNQTSSGFQPKTTQSIVSPSSPNDQRRCQSRPNQSTNNFKPPNFKARSELNLPRLTMPKKSIPKEKGSSLIVDTFRKRGGEQISSSRQPHRRNRSLSRSHLKLDRKEDESAKCPTCKKLFGVYIYQCSNGHSSCKECKQRSASCGLCSKPITETRNITLESYLAEKIVACPNIVDGCWLYYKLAEMETHLKECPFSELACPVETCSWRGKLQKLTLHFDDVHPEHRQGTNNIEMMMPNMKSNTTIMHLVDIGPYNFIIRIKFDEKTSNIYMVAQLYGTCVSASKWSYKFQISNGAKMYKYADECLPHFVATEDIYKNAKCVVLPMDFAVHFAKENALAYKFSLKREIPTWKQGFGTTSVNKNKNLRY